MVLVQYVVVRLDLLKKPHNWTPGAVAAQACHAASAIVWNTRENRDTKEYMAEEEGSRHTVVVSVKNEAKLRKLVRRCAASRVRCCD